MQLRHLKSIAMALILGLWEKHRLNEHVKVIEISLDKSSMREIITKKAQESFF